jgi:hypothetical protein
MNCKGVSCALAALLFFSGKKPKGAKLDFFADFGSAQQSNLWRIDGMLEIAMLYDA